jgi:hypothetical protein
MKARKMKTDVVGGADGSGGSWVGAVYSSVANKSAVRCCPLDNGPRMRWWIDLPASISSAVVRGGDVLVSCYWKSVPVRSSPTERRACSECGMKEVKNADDRRDRRFCVLTTSYPILEDFWALSFGVSPNTCTYCQAFRK